MKRRPPERCKGMDQGKIVLSRRNTPRGELQLQRWAASDEDRPVYEIIFNGVFLMATYNERSEKALARLAVGPLKSPDHGLRVLIGGLGIGYTLRAALDCEGVQTIDVIEIEEEIVAWAQGLFAKLNGNACSDNRTRIITTDLGEYLSKTRNTYDAIILDVDNGPSWLALDRNRRLYETPMLIRIKHLLNDCGVLTVWAAQECAGFQKRLEEVFGTTEMIAVRDTHSNGRCFDYFIYRARAFGNQVMPSTTC
jgi:spermidine synthase